MLKLLPVVIIGLMLAYLSQYRSTNDGLLIAQNKKEVFVYLIMAVVLIMFVGLRTKYNDTYVYIADYNSTPETGNLFAGLKWTMSESTGYRILNRLLRHLHVSTQSWLMIYAVIDVGIPLWFIRKYAEKENLFLTVFLFIMKGVYTFNLAAIMQCTATAFALVGVDMAIEKRWGWFVFFILLAATFHTYALVFLFVLLLSFRPWTKKTYWLLFGFLLVGLLLPRLLGLVVTVTSAMGEEYDIESFNQAGVNIFRFIVCAVPVVLSFMTRKLSAGKTTRTENIIVNLCMLNAEIMFVGLFGTANYFARLANYFLIFQAIALPWLLRWFDQRTRTMLYWGIIVCYIAYFVYANYFLYKFDNIFNSTSLITYLKIVYNHLFLGGA